CALPIFVRAIHGADSPAKGCRTGPDTSQPSARVHSFPGRCCYPGRDRSMHDQHDIQRLIDIMARLRDPDGGCPWDLEQDFASIAPYTVEEAYEVADAIDRGDMDGLREELGDLLLQVVFHARMAQEAGYFAFGDVVAGICDKMVGRHPHVFGDAEVEDAEAQTRAWEEHKRREREARGEVDDSAL